MVLSWFLWTVQYYCIIRQLLSTVINTVIIHHITVQYHGIPIIYVDITMVFFDISWGTRGDHTVFHSLQNKDCGNTMTL